MKRKFLCLRRLLCFVMLFCITFSVTSVTTKAAEGDIIFTDSSKRWFTSSSDSMVVGSSNSVYKGYYTCTWEFFMSAGAYQNYNGDYIEMEINNIYLPVSSNYNTSLDVTYSVFSFDSNSGVFMNGNRVASTFNFPSTESFRQYYSRTDSSGHVQNLFYGFTYIDSISFVVPKSYAQYLPRANTYVFRPSFTVYCSALSSGFIGLKYYDSNFEADYSTISWDNPSSFPLATCYFHETTKRPLSTVNTHDSGTQNAINNQTDTIQQGNDIAQEGNDIAQEGNDIAEDTNNKVTSFFSSFFDNLIGVFVPESGFFSQWFSDLNTFMGQKLGFLWAPFDFIITFLNGVYSGSGSASITFPELAWIDGTVIIPETQFSFEHIGGQSFTDLRDMIYFATDVILLGAVVMQFYQKLKLVFEGGSE